MTFFDKDFKGKMNENVAAATRNADRPVNTSVGTCRTVEFLLKQVYVAHREKIKGLESEVQQLKSELKKQKNGHEDCKQCKVLREELRTCREDYLKSLTDQKHRIELLEGRLLPAQKVPTSKSKMPPPSKANEEFSCDMNMDKQTETTCKKQKISKDEFLHPVNVTKQNFFSLGKMEHFEKENSQPLILQPLSNIIAPETLDVDINDDADVTVIGIYGKQGSDKISAETIVPESIDIDMLDVVEPEISGASCLIDGLTKVAPTHCNEIRTNNEERNTSNSPSLLPPISLLLGKPEYNVENKDDKQVNSRITPSLKLLNEKSESDLFHAPSDADVTSPSLIYPSEKKLKPCLNLPQPNEHKANDVVCSPVSCFDKDLLGNTENTLEDMDETYFPLPLTLHNTAQQNNRFESSDNNDDEVIEVYNSPSDVLIDDRKCSSEDNCSLTKPEQAKNNAALDVNNPAIQSSFDRVPKKDNDIRYKFKEETVRKKEERARLLGYPCKQCEEYYNKLDIPESEKTKRIAKCSRHRTVNKPPATPEHYWELDFPDTPECKARGYIDETQIVQLKPRRRCPLTLKKDK